MSDEYPTEEIPIEDSPIYCLLDKIVDALIDISPEREHELIQFFFDRNVEVLVEDFNGAQADIGSNQIKIGTLFLERLWAKSYAYFVLYDELSTFLNTQGHATFDFHENDRRSNAAHLLQWAIEGDRTERPLRWPEDRPKPRIGEGIPRDIIAANKIFLFATAFIEHHELSHLREQHRRATGLTSMEQEREADRLAAEWVFQDIDTSDDRYEPRVWGVIVALLHLLPAEIYDRLRPERHPPGYDRLYFTLERHLEDPDYIGWALTQAMLRIHFENASIPYSQFQGEETHKNIANHYIDILSRWIAANGS